MSDEPDELNAYYWVEQFDLCTDDDGTLDTRRMGDLMSRLQDILDRLKQS